MAQKPNQVVRHPLWVEVSGFKSLVEPTRAHLRPLTVFAGGNATGKTSFVQPLLLLKQTLEAPHDPGPLELGGPHVSFTSLDQMFSRVGMRAAETFDISFGPIPRKPEETVGRNRLPTSAYPPVRIRFPRGSGRSSGANLEVNEVAVLHGDHWVDMVGFSPRKTTGSLKYSMTCTLPLGSNTNTNS